MYVYIYIYIYIYDTTPDVTPTCCTCGINICARPKHPLYPLTPTFVPPPQTKAQSQHARWVQDCENPHQNTWAHRARFAGPNLHTSEVKSPLAAGPHPGDSGDAILARERFDSPTASRKQGSRLGNVGESWGEIPYTPPPRV